MATPGRSGARAPGRRTAGRRRCTRPCRAVVARRAGPAYIDNGISGRLLRGDAAAVVRPQLASLVGIVFHNPAARPAAGSHLPAAFSRRLPRDPSAALGFHPVRPALLGGRVIEHRNIVGARDVAAVPAPIPLLSLATRLGGRAPQGHCSDSGVRIEGRYRLKASVRSACTPFAISAPWRICFARITTRQQRGQMARGQGPPGHGIGSGTLAGGQVAPPYGQQSPQSLFFARLQGPTETRNRKDPCSWLLTSVLVVLLGLAMALIVVGFVADATKVLRAAKSRVI